MIAIPAEDAVRAKPVRKKLTEHLYELLKRDIVECTLEPGEQLLEAAVRDRYQIGHTPFREACHRLAAEGLVEIRPRRGSYVASFSRRDIRDVFELRLQLEPWAAALACERWQPPELAPLDGIVARFARLSVERPPQSFREVNRGSMAFHVGVARLAGNQELQAIIESLHSKLMRIIMFTARHTLEDELFDACHAGILEAIRNRSAAQARRLMVKDITSTRNWVRELTR